MFTVVTSADIFSVPWLAWSVICKQIRSVVLLGALFLYPSRFDRAISIDDFLNKPYFLRFLKSIFKFSDIIPSRKFSIWGFKFQFLNINFLLRSSSYARLKLYRQENTMLRRSVQDQHLTSWYELKCGGLVSSCRFSNISRASRAPVITFTHTAAYSINSAEK